MGYGRPLKVYKSKYPYCFESSSAEPTVEDAKLDCAPRSGDQFPAGGFKSLIVDQPKLREIARAADGKYAFPANPEELVSELQKIISSLQVYEIQYIQPKGDRGSCHSVKVKVAPGASDRIPEGASSSEKSVCLRNFSYQVLPVLVIISIGVISLLLFFLGHRCLNEWRQEKRKQTDLDYSS